MDNRTAIIVTREHEYFSLPTLLRRCGLPSVPDVRIAHVGPEPTANRMALEVSKLVRLFHAVGSTDVIAILNESMTPGAGVCPSQAAKSMEQRIKTRLGDITGKVQISVVLVVPLFESWLLADPQALKNSPQKYRVSTSLIQDVVKKGADTICNKDTLPAIMPDRAYDERFDAISIITRCDPLRAAANSRSLRRFLRVVGHPKYKDQSKVPVSY